MEKGGSDYSEPEDWDKTPERMGMDKKKDGREETEEITDDKRSKNSDLLDFVDSIIRERNEALDESDDESKKKNDYAELNELLTEVRNEIDTIDSNDYEKGKQDTTLDEFFSKDGNNDVKNDTEEDRINLEVKHIEIEDEIREMSDDLVQISKNDPIWGELRQAMLNFEDRKSRLESEKQVRVHDSDESAEKSSEKSVEGSTERFDLKNIQDREIFESFLNLTHENEYINGLVKEYNRNGLWMKSFRPTNKFYEFLKAREKELRESVEKSSKEEDIKNLGILSKYRLLIKNIREDNSLLRISKDLITENPGNYNAFDFEDWFMLTDTGARNQLKRMFTPEDYKEVIRTNPRIFIERAQEIAQQRGGKCLSEFVENAKSKILFECSEDVEFEATYDSVVNQGTWCPHCNINISEKICREYFGRIFNAKFPTVSPEWLVNDRGNLMHLDGYNAKLGIAFEYQGIQHEQIRRGFGMNQQDLEQRIKDDKLKAELCKPHGVILIQVPHKRKISYDNMQEYIMNEYTKITGIPLHNIPKYDYHDFNIYENENAEEFKEKIESRGAELLTPYISAKESVRIKCEEKHEFETTPNSINIGNWCPICAGNKKETTDTFQEKLNEHHILLLSEYVNAREKVDIKCPLNHLSSIKPFVITDRIRKNERICTICRKQEKFDFLKKEFTEEDIEILTRFEDYIKKTSVNLDLICLKCEEEFSTSSPRYKRAITNHKNICKN